MNPIVLETRRKPPFWLRVVGSGVINLLGLWIAGGLQLVSYNSDFGVLLLAAIVLAAINIVIRPMMMVLSIPLIIASLGFFMLVVNALMLWITDQLVPNFGLIGFWRTIGAAIILGFANLLFGGAMRDFTERPRRETYEFD